MADVNHTVLIPEELNAWAKAEVLRRRENGRYSMGELLRDGLMALQAGGITIGSITLPGLPVEKSKVGLTTEDAADELAGILIAEIPPSELESRLEAFTEATNEFVNIASRVSKPTAVELAAKLGIKTGATIEEVEPRLDSDSGYISPEQAEMAEDHAKILECENRFGSEATKRMLKMRPQLKRQGIKTWDQIFEVMQEQKDRE